MCIGVANHGLFVPNRVSIENCNLLKSLNPLFERPKYLFFRVKLVYSHEFSTDDEALEAT